MTEQPPVRRSGGRQRTVPGATAAPLDVPPPSAPQRPPVTGPNGDQQRTPPAQFVAPPAAQQAPAPAEAEAAELAEPEVAEPADEQVGQAATSPAAKPQPRKAATRTRAAQAPAADQSLTNPDAMLASLLAEPDTTDVTRVPADGGAGGRAISLAALMAGAPDPEVDLVPATLRLPRYVVNALKLTSQLTRRSQQLLVTDAIKAHLPGELLDQAYLNVAHRPRPKGQGSLPQ